MLYILDENRKPVRCPEFLAWATWMGTTPDRIVAQTDCSNGLGVSSVFIGIDPGSHWRPDRPYLFETAVFDKDGDPVYMQRDATWEEAEKRHAEAVAWSAAQGDGKD